MAQLNSERKMYFVVSDAKSGSVIDTLYFPYVPPFHFGKNYNIKTYDSVNGKQFSSYAGYDLEGFGFSVEFPTTDRSYSDAVDGIGFYKKADEYIRKQHKFTLTLTNPGISMDCYIERMHPRVDDKTFDLIIDFEIIERNEPQFLSWTPEKKTINAGKVITTSGTSTHRNVPKSVNSTENKKYHTVKKGDNLYDIAEKYYKKGNQYPKIKNNPENLRNYPKLKNSNVIYVGWKLLIP